MRKKCTLTDYTFLNIAICLSLVIWYVNQASNNVKAQPGQFLGPIYYGQVSITAVFDHNLPLQSGDNNFDQNEFVLHYDNRQFNPPIPDGFGYETVLTMALIINPSWLLLMGTLLMQVGLIRKTILLV